MPLHWTIDHEKRLLVATTEGDLTDSDLRAYLQRVTAAGAMPYAKIFDATKGRSFLKADQIEELGEWLQAYMNTRGAEVGPLAIVVASPEHFVQAEFFSDVAAGRRPVRVFRDHGSAHAWLREVACSVGD